MAEPLAAHLRMNSLLQQLSRVRMPLVMEPDVRQLGAADRRGKICRKCIGRDWRTIVAGTDQIVVLVSGSELQARFAYGGPESLSLRHINLKHILSLVPLFSLTKKRCEIIY